MRMTSVADDLGYCLCIERLLQVEKIAAWTVHAA